MQLLVLSLFTSVFTLDFLYRYEIVGRAFTWLPDIFSLLAIVVVVGVTLRYKTVQCHKFYVALMALLTLHILLGLILNIVPLGALITGIRNYFKFLPFFFLPLVYQFSERDINKQLLFVLVLALIQLPIASYQLFIESAGLKSGDLVGGSIGTSGHLSIFLVCVAGAWIAFYIKSAKQKPLVFWLVLVLLLVPTTMNQSKGTLILAPVAILVPILFAANLKGRLRHVLSSLLMLLLFTSIFIPIYDHYREAPPEKGLYEFYTSVDRLSNYLIRSDSIDTEKAGKVGGLILVNKELSSDPVKHFFGLGIGNTSASFFGQQYSGAYYEQYGTLGGATVSSLIWEIGWFGTLLVFVLFVRVFFDALSIRSENGVVGSLGLGWATVLAVMLLSMFYKNVIHANVIGYIFWFYSGWVVSQAYKSKFRSNKKVEVSQSVVSNPVSVVYD